MDQARRSTQPKLAVLASIRTGASFISQRTASAALRRTPQWWVARPAPYFDPGNPRPFLNPEAFFAAPPEDVLQHVARLLGTDT